jgi:hypothetical protein
MLQVGRTVLRMNLALFAFTRFQAPCSPWVLLAEYLLSFLWIPSYGGAQAALTASVPSLVVDDWNYLVGIEGSHQWCGGMCNCGSFLDGITEGFFALHFRYLYQFKIVCSRTSSRDILAPSSVLDVADCTSNAKAARKGMVCDMTGYEAIGAGDDDQRT